MRRAPGALAAAALARGLATGAIAAAVLAARLLERGEAFSPRTGLLLLIFAGCGFAAGAIVSLLLDLARRRGAATRFAIGASCAPLVFVASFFAVFAAMRNATELAWSLREEGIGEVVRHALIGLTIDAAGVFVVMGRGYLLPWPLLALALAAGAVAAARARR